VRWGLWRFYVVRAAYQTARELAEHGLSLAQGIHDPPLLLVALYALGATVDLLGEPAAARTHLEQAIALYDPGQHHHLAFR
jgi:Tetratricopeptide repeat